MEMKEKVIHAVNNIDFSKNFVWSKGEWFSYELFFCRCYSASMILQEYADYGNVIVILENGLLLCELYFAAMLSGKTIIAIDPLKGEGEIGEILSSISRALVIKENEVGIEENCKFYNVSERFLKSDYSKNVREDIKQTIINSIEKRNFEDVYLITFTSGTTGSAKGIKHSLNNLFGSAYAMLDKTCLESGQRFLHVMPMTYMAGILNSIFYPFIAELEIVISNRFSVKEALRFWEVVIEYEITVFWLSPAMVLMIEQVDRKEIGIEYCKNHEVYFHVGTAALTDKIREKFEQRYGITLFASYGLSETLFVSIETIESKRRGKENNVGGMLEGIQYTLGYDDELNVKVPWMFLGYTNEETDQYFTNGYYKTGDLVKFEDDILYITGRKKELIIRGGINISPVKIEKIVMEEEMVKECVVFSIKNQFDDELTCCAYVADGSDKVCEELERRLNKRIAEILGRAYCVDSFCCVKELSRNINGKLDRKKLERLFEKSNDNKI